VSGSAKLFFFSPFQAVYPNLTRIVVSSENFKFTYLPKALRSLDCKYGDSVQIRGVLHSPVQVGSDTMTSLSFAMIFIWANISSIKPSQA
jgi:hypothetical protein